MSVTFYIATAESDEYTMRYDDAEGSLNMANVNAAALLCAVGQPAEYSTGWIAAADVSNVLQRTIVALNTTSGRAPLVRKCVTSPRYVDCGTNDAYAVDRLTHFARLLKRAVELKRLVYWA